MTLYPQTASPTVLWPEPMESVWQSLAGGGPTPLAPKLPHLSLADVLFIGAVILVLGYKLLVAWVYGLLETAALSSPTGC